MFKVYLSDTGLLMNMMGPSSQTALMLGDTSYDFGAVTENAVCGCLFKAGYDLSYYRRTSGRDKKEIDAVIEDGGLVCIEVKTGAEREYPSLRKTLSDGNVVRRIVFERGNIAKDQDGIEHYPLFAAAFLFPERTGFIEEYPMGQMLGDPFTERIEGVHPGNPFDTDR